MTFVPSSTPSFETISVTHNGAEVHFCVVNSVSAWRAQTVMTKEPGTISWIEQFAPGEVFLDIGANVGTYSLCAARFRGMRVFAFEPESQNYGLLNLNIHQNGLDEAVTAYCVALSDRTSFDSLFLSRFEAGAACHTFGESVSPDLEPMRPAYRQGCFATTVDALIEQAVLPVPNHIKIDVDGLEHKVIAGARKTLEDRALRSVLVEVNTGLEQHWEAVDLMLALGFDYSRNEAQRATREHGAFKGTGNYVFRR